MRWTGRDGRSLREIEALYREGCLGGWPDARLVERFALHRSERAFAALVDRHGPRVLRVCRAITGDRHSAEDAFQATFLVLARKAHSLRVGESLGPWLRAVAARVATNERTKEARRRRREDRVAGWRDDRTEDRRLDGDLAGILHLEIERLPAPYRDVLLLCDVEGLSHEEAADRLRRPVGTVKSRHSRGRSKLRDRLIRRGIAPALTLTLTMPLIDRASAAVPAAVPAALRAAATRVALLQARSGPIPGTSPAMALLREGTKTAMTTQFRLTLGALVLALTTTAAVVLAQGTPRPVDPARPADPGMPDVSRAAPPPERPEGAPVPLPVAKAPSALDPPSDAEVWREFLAKMRREALIDVEKIRESEDLPRIYPLAGPCVLVHVHYKCTLTFPADEATGRPRREVLFLDKDHLRRLTDSDVPPPQMPVPTGPSPAAIAPAPAPRRPAEAADQEGRLAEVERKLDRILQALEGPRAGVESPKVSPAKP